MIVVNKKMRLAVQRVEPGTTFMRLATHQYIPYPERGDVLVDDDLKVVETDFVHADEILPIISLRDMKKQFTTARVINAVLVVIFWALLIFQIVISVYDYYDNGMAWYRFLAVSIISTAAILYTQSARNLVVHDLDGNWLHLRTGQTNLNGGTSLRPRRT